MWSPRVATALTLLLLCFAIGLSWAPDLLSAEATVLAVKGAAGLRSAGSVAWQPAREGARLHEGDGVRAFEGAVALGVFDGSCLSLEPGAELILTGVRSGLFGIAVRVEVSQSLGAVAYDVKALRGPWSSFKVASPAAWVSVRGTRFVVIVHSSDESRVEVLEGSVEVVNEGSHETLVQNEVVIVAAGAAPVHLPSLTPAPKPGGTNSPGPRPTGTDAPRPRALPPEPLLAPTVTVTAPSTASSPGLTPSSTPTATSEASTADSAKSTEVPSPSPRATSMRAVTRTRVPSLVEFKGIIERLPPSLLGVWRVGGEAIAVGSQTKITGLPTVGRRVSVTALKHAARPLEAALIVVHELNSGVTATPVAGAATSTSWATGQARPTRTPVSSETRASTGVSMPSTSATPTRAVFATPAIGLARRPTLTRAATPMVPPDNVTFSGTIESFPPGLLGLWMVGGRGIVVTPSTQISGTPAVGAVAHVDVVALGPGLPAPRAGRIKIE